MSLVLISDAAAVVNETFFSNIKEQLQINFVSMFQLANVAVIISKKNVKALFDESYNESMKSIKFLIQKLQTNNTWTKKFLTKKRALLYYRRHSKTWFIDSKKFVKHNERLYVFENKAVRKKLISKHYNNFLIEHFDFDKIVNLLLKKYYWIDCVKQTNEYIKICDICQRIKASRHKLYNKLSFLSIFRSFWKKIIINFITNLLSNKRKKVVYNFIFVIVNRCIKIIKYISITIKCDNVELIKIFFSEIVFKFDMLNDIVNNRKVVFINAF